VPEIEPIFDPTTTEDSRSYRFELKDDASSKYWEIIREGNSFTTRHGRIGSAGQSQSKNWPNQAACRRESIKLIREKMRKGYRLLSNA
jgi:predicted DNA-binding WGR domain protein